MGRPPRIRYRGAFYHVYNRGVNKAPIVFNDHDRRTFFSLLARCIPEYQARLFAFCLMDNHFHLYIQTQKANLDQFMWDLQSNHAKAINERQARVGAFFQGRYKSKLVMNDAYSLTLARYIHRNPLEAGLVRSLEEYTWSSYPCYTGTLPSWPWLETSWLLNQLSSDVRQAKKNFIQSHQTPVSEADRTRIERRRGPL